MSLGVQSYPELYTILLGWDLYGKLWELLSQTGIAFVPFIGMILKNIAQSYVTHGHHGTGFSLRSMEMNLLTTLLIIFLGVAPLIPLEAHTVTYTPLCEKNSNHHPGSTGTTYDKAFAIPDGDIRVPLWWYAVISVSEGLTSAANTMVGCVPNLRKMITEVDMAQISDPEIKQQLQDFTSMCYASARSKFFKDTRENNVVNLERIQQNIHQFGIDDTEWIGSHAFNDVYYSHLKAARPIPGFLYKEAEDINADIETASFGRPSCYEWWNDLEKGLKIVLYQALPKQFSKEYKDFLGTDNEKDNVIKKIISKAPTGYTGYSNANNMIGDVGYSHLVSSLGIWFNQLEEYPKIYAASQAAPIIQALLLLMVYVFLPFALIFSGYKPSAFVAGGVLIFSLIFWSFIWHLVSWTDKSLMQALYVNWFSQQGAGASLTDMVIGTLVIVAPLFWFLFMGSMGVAAGHAVNGAFTSLNKIGDSSVKNSGPAATEAVTTAAKTAASI